MRWDQEGDLTQDIDENEDNESYFDFRVELDPHARKNATSTTKEICSSSNSKEEENLAEKGEKSSESSSESSLESSSDSSSWSSASVFA